MSTDYFAIDSALKEALHRKERRFNAYTVAYWANQSDATEVNRYLLSKVGIVLWARVEFLCPNGHLTESIEFGEKVPSIAECHICREEFVPSLDESNIVFGFKPVVLETAVVKKTPQDHLQNGTPSLSQQHLSQLMTR